MKIAAVLALALASTSCATVKEAVGAGPNDKWFTYADGYHPMRCTKYGCRFRSKEPVVTQNSSYQVLKERALATQNADGTTWCPKVAADINKLPEQSKNSLIKEITAKRKAP